MRTGKDNCIFCKIAKKEIAVSVEYEDGTILAFNDKDPQAPVHVLLVPKEHIENVNDLTGAAKALLGEMAIAAQEIAKKREVSGTGYRMVINCGKDSGQLVRHLHMHLLGGRRFGWPPG